MIKNPMTIKISSPMMGMNPMKALKERRSKMRTSNEPLSITKRHSDMGKITNYDGNDEDYSKDMVPPPPPPPPVESKSDSFINNLPSLSFTKSPKMKKSSKKSPKSTSPKRKNSKSNTEKDNVKTTKTNTTSSSSSPKPQPKKKGVRFEPEQDKVHRCVPRLSTITPFDRQQLWFDSQEFGDMYDDCERTVQKLNNGKKLKDKKYSAVGLEGWTARGREERAVRKEDAWEAVFEEQYVGYKQGRRVSMNVSSAYQKASEDAKQRAVDVAMGIHNDVSRFLMKKDGSLMRLMMAESSQDDSSLHLSTGEDGSCHVTMDGNDDNKDSPKRRDSL